MRPWAPRSLRSPTSGTEPCPPRFRCALRQQVSHGAASLGAECCQSQRGINTSGSLNESMSKCQGESGLSWGMGLFQGQPHGISRNPPSWSTSRRKSALHIKRAPLIQYITLRTRAPEISEPCSRTNPVSSQGTSVRGGLHIDCGFIHSSQDLEATSLPISGGRINKTW